MEAKLANPTLESKRKLWNKLLSNGSLQMPKYCPRCNSSVYTYENNTELNPYIVRSCSNKCRKYIYIRHNTFYNFFPKTLYQL